MYKEDILCTCYICNTYFSSVVGCCIHIAKKHKNINKTDYFLEYITPLIVKHNIESKWRFNIINKCRMCNKETEFISINNGFKCYCCKECQFKDKKPIQKRVGTCLKKYGVRHPLQNKNVLKKQQDTCMEKYGVKNIFQDPKTKQKIKQINIEKYGHMYAMQNKDIQDKVKGTCLKKYGVEYPLQNKNVLKKQQDTCMEKYGNKCSLYNKESQKKSKSTWKNKTNKNIKSKFEPFTDKYSIIKLPMDSKQYERNILLKCLICGEQFNTNRSQLYVRLFNSDKDQLCPKCYPRNTGTSLKEQKLLYFIKQNVPETKILINSRKILSSGKELDIYLPEFNFAIEFNGMYWHSEQAGKNKNYHINKTIECERLNIHLIHIFESEWDNKVTRRIIKYKILNKLKLTKNRIHTRKCTVRKLETKKEKELARRFLDLHHIQGRDKSGIYYGLIYEKKIVAIMSFSKSRRNIFGDRNKNNNIELVRFASHLKYNLPGAGSRLLKNFLKYNKYNIISYAHRRLTNINNNLYQKLEFTLKHISSPGYYYWDGKKLYHRYNFRKSKLIEMGYDKNMTEKEITDNMGLLRIWDCGQLVYVKGTQTDV